MECYGPQQPPIAELVRWRGFAPIGRGPSTPLRAGSARHHTTVPRPHLNQFFHAQEPGPSGLPHYPQGPEGIVGAALPLADTANTESLGSSFLLSHFGQAAFSLP